MSRYPLNTLSNRFDEKERILKEYFQATMRMKKFFEKDNFDLLDGCVKDRQRLIKDMERIDKDIKEIVRLDKEPSRFKFHDNKQKVKGIEQILYDISKIEREFIFLTKTGLDRMKTEILSLRSKRRISGGYRGTVSPLPRFIDTKK